MDPSMDTCQYIRCTAAQFSINEVPGFDVLGVPDQFPLDVSQFRLKKNRGNVIYRGLSFMWKNGRRFCTAWWMFPPIFLMVHNLEFQIHLKWCWEVKPSNEIYRFFLAFLVWVFLQTKYVGWFFAQNDFGWTSLAMHGIELHENVSPTWTCIK